MPRTKPKPTTTLTPANPDDLVMEAVLAELDLAPDTPTGDAPLPLAADDVLRLMYDAPASTPGSTTLAGDPTRTNPDILSKPAFGQAQQHTPAAPLTERENRSYEWTRGNYHNFVEHIESIESARKDGLESNLGAQDLRDYTLKQLIGLSGHPDPRIAIKALDMLAKSKFVALYDEKRARTADEMSPDEIDREITRLLGK